MSRRTTSRPGYRPDIDGLRALAVLAVLGYHAGVPALAGGYVGVDVFFVISGFLITGLLVAELDRTGRISLGGFYARRVRRLLPAAVTVLLAVAIASAVLLPPVQRADVAGQVASAGFYVINWALAIQTVDYFAGETVNPVQHFWSLAVEEQFYLFWPALLLLVAYVTWRLGSAHRRRALVAAIGAVAIASFGYNLYLSYRGEADAYFSTLTRVWELAVGGGLALALHRLPAIRVLVARGLGLLGLALICWAVVSFGDDTSFPGLAALLPTFGAAALIVAGAYDSGGVSRVLTLRPVRHIGHVSYSWYLWHWPVLVFVAAVVGELSPQVGVGVAALSYLPAVLSYRFVEQPFRSSRLLRERPAWNWRLAVGSTGLAAMSGLVLWVSIPDIGRDTPDTVAGAAAVRESDELQQTASRLRPDPLEAKDDLAQIDADGCQVEPTDIEVPDCVYGREDADTTVVAFGDSHMMQYGPALDKLAETHDWRVPVFIKSGCSPSNTTLFNAAMRREYTECDEWREAVLKKIEAENPDMILLTGRATTDPSKDGRKIEGEERDEALEKGWTRTLERLRENTSAEVVVIRDNPQLDEEAPACVSRSLKRLEDCAQPVGEALSFEPVEVNAAERVDGVHVVDLTPVFCPDDVCPAVIGDAIVYRDNEHLTATFVETLPDWLDEQLPSLPDRRS